MGCNRHHIEMTLSLIQSDKRSKNNKKTNNNDDNSQNNSDNKEKKILQILLQSNIEKEDFIYYLYTTKVLLNNKDKYIIIQLINKYLSDNTADYYLALSESLTYFFEKNSLIYLKHILKDESLEKNH